VQVEGKQRRVHVSTEAGYSTPASALIRSHTHERSANSIRATVIFVALHFLQEGRLNNLNVSYDVLQSVRKGAEFSPTETSK
jgi:hypothetical protein